MSFDGAPKSAQESREDKIRRLQTEIEGAEASYDGEEAGRLRAELESLRTSSSTEQLAQKYDVQKDALAADLVSSGQAGDAEVRSQEVVSELATARSGVLFAMQEAVRQGGSLTKQELRELYFGRFYNTANMNDALEVLDLQAGNIGNKYPGKTEKLRSEINLKNLAVMFDCDNPSRQIATDFKSFFDYRNDVKVFIGKPTKELVEYLDDNSEIVTRVNFFVPSDVYPGAMFPIEKMTLDDMKVRLGLLSSLSTEH